MFAVVYIVGACCGGTDFIVFHLSNKGKTLGKMMVVFNFATTFIGCALGSYIPAGLTNSAGWNYQFLFSTNTVSSFYASIILVSVLGIFFPTSKYMKVEVFSQKNEEINKKLIDINYAHSGTFYSVQGARRKQEFKSYVTFCTMVELSKIVEIARTVDPSAFMIVTKIAHIDG
jgi:uncharacterized membrane-anchored protein YitT (DUF2179 family)